MFQFSQNISNNWLTKWRKEISQSLEDNIPLNSAQNKNGKIIQQRIGKLPAKPNIREDKLEELTKLHKPQNMDNKETSP